MSFLRKAFAVDADPAFEAGQGLLPSRGFNFDFHAGKGEIAGFVIMHAQNISGICAAWKRLPDLFAMRDQAHKPGGGQF